MLMIGQLLKSYCNGYFGRDFYGGRIEAVGWDWAVARSDPSGNPALADFPGGMAAHEKFISEWLIETAKAQAEEKG